MGDVRYLNVLRLIEDAPDRAAAIAALSDEDVVAGLAATAMTNAPYMANVLASEAMNRVRQKETVFDHAAEGICVVDAQCRIRQLNAAGERLLGWAQSELIGEDFHERIHFSDAGESAVRKNSSLIQQKCVVQGQAVRCEDARFECRDQRLIPVAYSAAPIRRDAAIHGAVIIFHDISEQLRAKTYRAAGHAVTAILASADRLAEAGPAMIQTIGEAFDWQAGALWLPDPRDGALRCVQFWKRQGIDPLVFEAASRIMSFQPGEGFPGKIFRSVTPLWVTDFSRLDPHEYPRAGAAAQDGFKALFGFSCRAKGRSLGVIEFASHVAREPGAQLLERAEDFGAQLGNFIAHELAQEALLASEARKAGLVRASLDGIIAIDSEGMIIEWNPAAEDILGWTTQEAIGRELASLIIPERYRAAHRRGMQHYLATGEGPILGRRLSMPALRRDGTEFASELSIVPVREGRSTFFTGFLRDVSGGTPPVDASATQGASPTSSH